MENNEKETYKRFAEHDYYKTLNTAIVVTTILSSIQTIADFHMIFIINFIVNFFVCTWLAFVARYKLFKQRLTRPAAFAVSLIIRQGIYNIFVMLGLIALDKCGYSKYFSYEFTFGWSWMWLCTWILSHQVAIPGASKVNKSKVDEDKDSGCLGQLWLEVLKNLSIDLSWPDVEKTDFGEAIKAIYQKNLGKDGDKEKIGTFVVESAALDVLERRVRGFSDAKVPANVVLLKQSRKLAKKMYMKRYINDESYNCLLERIEILEEKLKRKQ